MRRKPRQKRAQLTNLGIILNGKDRRAIENYVMARGRLPSRPSVRVRMAAFRAGMRGDRADWQEVLRRRRIREMGVGEMLLNGIGWCVDLPSRLTYPFRPHLPLWDRGRR